MILRPPVRWVNWVGILDFGASQNKKKPTVALACLILMPHSLEYSQRSFTSTHLIIFILTLVLPPTSFTSFSFSHSFIHILYSVSQPVLTVQSLCRPPGEKEYRHLPKKSLRLPASPSVQHSLQSVVDGNSLNNLKTSTHNQILPSRNNRGNLHNPQYQQGGDPASLTHCDILQPVDRVLVSTHYSKARTLVPNSS